jgi:hypothetical protein
VTSIPSIETPRGRTQISSRAMSRVGAVVAAEALGIEPGDVTVDFTEDGESLEITLNVFGRALPSESGRSDGESDDESLRARAEQSTDQIRTTLGEVTGARITAVSVRLTKTRLHLPRLSD